MLTADANYPYSVEYWRRINMRKVAHIVAAESLHNLYNRHWPQINSIRFRHTVTNYKDGVVESYAPKAEWDFLQHWLSKKFMDADPVLLNEIESILQPTYDLVNGLLRRVDSCELNSLTNQELALLFIDIMDIPLGEIYRLNVVQIEYSLNYALHTILSQYEPNKEDRNLLLSKLIAPGALTVAQEEEVEFAKLIRRARRLKAPDPYQNVNIKKSFQAHVSIFAPKHCAYGELPPTEKDYVKKYRAAYTDVKPLVTPRRARQNLQIQLQESEKILTKINDVRLTRLCKLMARIGVFRDQNKAKMGETVTRRLRIFSAIAARTRESRNNLDLYLLSEIVTLLDTGEKVKRTVLTERNDQGVSFTRFEDVGMGVQQITPAIDSESTKTNLSGICASSGVVEGEVKIIYSKDDIVKMSPGDIMVAIGTDFDLIEIMNMSAGIITEEGGLLSHASVVSRELKKPCLIGVEGATQIFKDGDTVRLDAHSGVVEIK